MANLLLVEDDSTFARILAGFLTKQGHHVEVADTVKKGVEALDRSKPRLLLLDYRLADGTGLDMLAAARDRGLHIPAIIMTSFNDVRTAVKAMRLGAYDYITKPVNPDELLMVLNKALAPQEETPQAATPKNQPVWIEGKSDVSEKLQEYIKLVGPTNMSVIIQGESGTGKEYVARSIHRLSNRADKPFVAIDCGALSKELAASELFGHLKGAFTGALQNKKGQIEAADGGTLFLDEVGNLSYEVQVKLLRALQERFIQPIGGTQAIQVDVRIVAATNDDLLNSVANGDFREDLYHRLNEFKIQVPALRNRGHDLEIFTQHFIDQANHELGRNVKQLSANAIEIFRQYDWPGNLRQLKNVVKRMVLLSTGQEAGKELLPDEMILALHAQPRPDSADLKAHQEVTEKELILKTLQEVKHNKSKAAKLLNIDRKTLYSKMAKYGIEG